MASRGRAGTRTQGDSGACASASVLKTWADGGSQGVIFFPASQRPQNRPALLTKASSPWLRKYPRSQAEPGWGLQELSAQQDLFLASVRPATSSLLWWPQPQPTAKAQALAQPPKGPLSSCLGPQAWLLDIWSRAEGDLEQGGLRGLCESYSRLEGHSSVHSALLRKKTDSTSGRVSGWPRRGPEATHGHACAHTHTLQR